MSLSNPSGLITAASPAMRIADSFLLKPRKVNSVVARTGTLGIRKRLNKSEANKTVSFLAVSMRGRVKRMR